MDFIDYREKLGIGFDNRELENIFFNRLFNVLDDLSDTYYQISSDEYYEFCRQTGYPMKHGITEGWDIVINVLHSNSRTIKEFLPYYMYFINCQKDGKHKKWKKENFKNLICNCLNETHIPFDILEENGNYFIFPKGAKELDNALISEPFEWLKKYPNSRKVFIKALKAYSEVVEDTASDVADLLRKTLETFFQEFFNSDKSLENLKSQYGTFLSKKGVPSEIANNFEKLLEAYTKFNNNYAKHHNKTSLNVLEYIMYQTGNLIRLLITLNQEDTDAN